MRKKDVISLLFAFFIALIAASIIHYMYSKKENKVHYKQRQLRGKKEKEVLKIAKKEPKKEKKKEAKKVEPKVKMVNVLKVKKDIKRGEKITKENTVFVSIPIDKLDPYHYVDNSKATQKEYLNIENDFDKAMESIALFDMSEGMDVKSGHIVHINQPGVISQIISSGKRAITVPFIPGSVAKDIIVPGDKVDVFVMDKGLSFAITNAKVIAIDNAIQKDMPEPIANKMFIAGDKEGALKKKPANAKNEYKNVTLEIMPDQIPFLAQTIKNKSGVILSLKNPNAKDYNDDPKLDTNTVNMEDIVGYGYQMSGMMQTANNINAPGQMGEISELKQGKKVRVVKSGVENFIQFDGGGE